MILTGKVALITGGKRIGLVVAEELARRGVDVGLGYARSRPEAEEAAGRVRAAGRRAAIVQADLADPEACRDLVARVADALGGLDILIKMASVPLMRARGGGRIVNFSDWTAKSGRPRYRGFLPYYVAKAGVMALTEALALELAADNILVNAVAPGPILAPPDTSAEDSRAVEEPTPLGRWGGEIENAK